MSTKKNKNTPEILAEIPCCILVLEKIPWFQGTTVARHPPWRRSPHPSLELGSVINSTGEANWLLGSTWTLCILHMYICIYIPTDRDVRRDQNGPSCAFLHVAGWRGKNYSSPSVYHQQHLRITQYSTNKGRVEHIHISTGHWRPLNLSSFICFQSCLLCCQPEPSLNHYLPPPSLHVLNLQSCCVLLSLLEIRNMTSNQVKIVPAQEERNHWPISTWPSWINLLEAVILFSCTNFPLQNGAPNLSILPGLDHWPADSVSKRRALASPRGERARLAPNAHL